MRSILRLGISILSIAFLAITSFAQAPKVYLHTGSANSASSPWNNALSQPYGGTVFGDLKDDSGNNTGIKVELLTGWGGAYLSGVTTGNNTGIVPDAVLEEYYWFGLGISANEMHVKVSGLMPSASYTFKFMGASAYHGSGISDNGNTIYTIGTSSASLHVENNKTSLASIPSVSPNAQGEVEIVVTLASNAAAGYLNAIIIELPADVLYTPSGLGSSFSAGSVSLTWNDNNTTETGYDIYRASVIDGEDFQLVGTTAASISTFVDNAVLEGYTYQYKVRAKNPTRTSSFSSAYQAVVPVAHGSTITPGSYIYFDFGKGNSGPAPWNIAGREPAQGMVFSNMTDQAGVSTGVNVELLTAWGGSYTDGATTGNNSGIVPDNILKDYYWFGLFGAPDVVRFRITGFTAGSSYNVRLIGSSVFRQAGVTDNGHTVYTIGTDEVSLDVEGNTSQSADFTSIKANAKGEVVVTIRKGSDATVGFINAMIIDLPTGAMYTPASLKGVYAEASGVSLSWSDNNSSETGYEIYRSNVTTSQPYALVATTAANAVSYVDATVSQNTIYKYKIRAVNGGGASNNSQEITTRTMPIKKVLFSFGKSVDGPTPWNNAKSDPQAGIVFKDLKDEYNVVTGLTLQLLTEWGGVSGDGAQTGNNSGIVPDNVLKEYYWFAFLGAPNEVQFKIAGLSPDKLYNFKIVGSSVFRYGNLTDNGNTIYTIGNTSVSLSVESNTSASAEFYDIAPDANGEVIVKAIKGSNAFAGYINAIMIDLPKDMLYVPSGVTAKYVAGVGVNLNWVDNNTTETGYQIYRSTTSGSGYSLVATAAASAVSYTDATVQEGTLYYYKIKGISSTTASGYTGETLVRAVEFKKLSFKFGKNFATPAQWNSSGADPVIGAKYAHLTDEFGIDAGVSIKLLTSWGGLYSGGPTTGNNSGAVPDNVLQEYFWFGMFGAPEEVTFLVSGLHPLKTYNFKFLGSAIYHVSGTDNGNTVYLIGNRSVSLAVENNTSNFAELKEVQPNASGEVQVTIRKGAGAMAGFINALVIEMQKNLLYAPPVRTHYTQGTGVAVTWTDNNSAEGGYEIYRSTNGEDAYTLLTTTAASASNFTDNGVVHGSTYYYKIRAVNGSNLSVYSAPSIADCINKQLVRFKFGKNLSVPAPWNNAARDPAPGATFTDLIDDTGNNSGVGIELLGDWQGVYNQGTTTGNDSGIVPDNVLGEYYYFGFLSVTSEVKYKVKGLIPSARYSFRFVGSTAFRGGGVTDNGNTVYSIGEESMSLYVEGNTSNYAEIVNAVADVNGEIEVRISKGQGASVGYINAMILEVPAGGLNFWAISNGNWSDAIWNTSKAATVGTHLPAGSSARIEGRTVTVNATAAAKEITVSASGATAGQLIVDGAQLTNSGALEISANGNNVLKVINDGKLTVTGNPVRIMPIGNSITQGNFQTPNPPEDHQSYRYELWKKLVDEGVNFDFIGSQTTNYGGNPPFPDYNGKTFDTDNEGHFGYRADEIAAGLPAWLSGRTPDIALVHAGTNDMNLGDSVSSTVDDIMAIIAALRTANPSVKICLGQIVPNGNPGRNANVILLNAEIKRISEDKNINTEVSPIFLVDQFTNFDMANLEADKLHVKPAGEKFMAEQWYKGLLRAFQSGNQKGVARENVSQLCGEDQYATGAITFSHVQLSKGCDNKFSSADKVILGKDFVVEKGSRLTVSAAYSKDVLEYDGNYNGLISSIRWRTKTPFGVGKNDFTGGYTFSYNDSRQIKDATWAELDLTTSQLVSSSNKFRLTNMSYDPNGNTKTLKRYNALGFPVNDFQYHYGNENNGNGTSNQLTSVDGYTKNYGYDTLGQVTSEQREDGDSKDDQYVDYDVTGKVTFVYTNSLRTEQSRKVQYLYDDRGYRLAKIVFQPSARTTWYIRDAAGTVVNVYEQEGQPTNPDIDAPPTITEIPVYGSSKLGTFYPQQDESMDYELTDHLGNIRALVRDNKASYLATMEDTGLEEYGNPRVQEGQYFLNLDESEQEHVSPGLNHTPQTGSYVPNYAAYLNGSEGRIVGPAITLRVQAGDQLHLNTFAKFEEAGSYSNTVPLISLISALTSTFAISPGVESIAQVADMFTDGFAVIAPYGDNDERPRAFLNYILFDQEMNHVGHDFIQVGTEGFQPNHAYAIDFEELSTDVNVSQNGYIYIYVSNETPGVNVWFDDLGITLKQEIVKQATDYGVWGDILREQKADESEYRYAYQGQFAERDLETGWTHFQLREYDPIIGRWTVADPKRQFYSPYVGMGNNPVNRTDPDGGSANSEFINAKTGERRHVDDKIDMVVVIEDKNWKSFLKFLDLTEIISTPSQRFGILSKFGTSYMVGDMLDFYNQHINVQKWEYGTNLLGETNRGSISKDPKDHFTNKDPYNVTIWGSDNPAEKANFHVHYDPWDVIEGLSPKDDKHKGMDFYNVMISPNNVYFYNRGTNKITDFGHLIYEPSGVNFTIPRSAFTK